MSTWRMRATENARAHQTKTWSNLEACHFQRYIDSSTYQIELIDDTIFAEPNQTYQIKYQNKDINII